MPLQALAAPGWLCANAVHHQNQVQSHPHATAGIDVDMAVVGAVSHSHEAAIASDQVETDQPTPGLIGVGKCSACSGCCFSAFAVPPAAASPALDQRAYEVAAYVSPAMTARPADGLFRPPRTLTA